LEKLDTVGEALVPRVLVGTSRGVAEGRASPAVPGIEHLIWVDVGVVVGSLDEELDDLSMAVRRCEVQRGGSWQPWRSSWRATVP